MYKFGIKIKGQNSYMNELFDNILEEMKINKNDENEKRKIKYCGFVWFVIPKVIMNIKVLSKKRHKHLKKEESAEKKEN